MVGGNDSTEKMIHREIPRVLVLRPLATTRCSEHCSGDLSLDNAFALIDGGNDSTEKMIHREIPRVLVLRPLATTRCSEHCSGDLSLDNAFALIEGHSQDEEKKELSERRRKHP